jgi:hypothetical protein
MLRRKAQTLKSGVVWIALFSLVAVWLFGIWIRKHFQDPMLDTPLAFIADLVPIGISVVGVIVSPLLAKRVRLVSLLMIAVGLIGTGLMSWNRLRLEKARKQEVKELNDKLAAIGNTNAQTLNTVLGQSQPPITDRQKALALLRNEYILSHNNIPASVLAGSQLPPTDWINAQLKARGQSWTIAPDERNNPAAPVLMPALPKAIKINGTLSCGPENYKLPEKSNDPPLGPWTIPLAFGTDQTDGVRLAARDSYAECRFRLSNEGSAILNAVELSLETNEDMEFYDDANTAFGIRRNNALRVRNRQLGGPNFPRIQIAASKDGNSIPQPADIANRLSLKNDGEYRRFPFCLVKIPGLVSMFVLSYELTAEDGNSGNAIKPIKGSVKFNVTWVPATWGRSRP